LETLFSRELLLCRHHTDSTNLIITKLANLFAEFDISYFFYLEIIFFIPDEVITLFPLYKLELLVNY